MSNLLRHNFNQIYVNHDFETSNLALLTPYGDSIVNLPWQLGYNIYQGKNQIESHEEWIKWPFPWEIGKAAAEITHFTWEKYHQISKDPVIILDKFEKWLYDPNVINVSANGARFDIYVHNIYRHLLKRPTDYSYLSRHVDIQVLHKAIVLGLTPPPIGSNEWVSFTFKVADYHKKGLKSSIKHMCEFYEVPYLADQHHKDASADAEMSQNIFQKQIWKLEI